VVALERNSTDTAFYEKRRFIRGYSDYLRNIDLYDFIRLAPVKSRFQLKAVAR
jgi:hypothetical protein